ncbi:hypothetical protein [Chryseobacterium sp. Leaf394]|uniref:hypothetical protein n=1 Tax=Chryseobacterium sp. Leaf394 TaxID=1736361 RepID=UPI0006F1E356|nr:hypothetical protein [Chryseobacterium sp. Leaf394]KQS89278.1 hypothetical protein ASG21_15955 [Chryseobacterium sp. Leaf394]
MTAKLPAVSRKRYWDYFILVSRFLLAYTFIHYGYGKLTTGGQFGISAAEMSKPLKDLPLFQVMWYLFDHGPFQTTVGILQIVTGLLLLFESTAILGVIFFIPVAANIVLMDISFMNNAMGNAFSFRFAFYFILCFAILWNDKERVKIIWHAMIKKFVRKRKFPWIMYALVPVFAIVLSLVSAIPNMIYYYIIFPEDLLKIFDFLK